MKFLQLDFIPRSSDLALLVLRLWLGLSMLLLHGLAKAQNFQAYAGKFMPLFGLDPKVGLSLAIFAELVCSGLLILGLFTRFAALNLVATMSVAFFMAHGMKLSGEGSGELAFIYLAGYVTLFLAGAGKFSVDASLTKGR